MDPKQLSEYVIAGDPKGADAWTRKAVSEGIDPSTIINSGLMSGMAVVGDKFKRDEYFLPDVLISVKAMKAAMEVLKPLLVQGESPRVGRVVIGTVKGDLHDVGKNLVAVMLEGSGFEVIDVGTNVSPAAFAEAVKEHKPQILGLSALLTTTMQALKTTIEFLEQSGLRDQVKVIVGGAPVTEAYAMQIGADGYAPEAASAVTLAKGLVSVQTLS